MPTINKSLPDATTWTGTTGATWTSHGASMTVERFMPTFPTIAVECGFGDDPFTASPTWTDITAYITEKSTMQHGKQHELARIEAGTASFVLYSSDDRFNPENTAGAYYPNLKPLVPIRVRVTDPLTSVVYTVWRGFVQGWPQTWTLNGKQSRVPIRCVDALGLFARTPITDWETTVNADSPEAFWRFGTEILLTDETANDHDGTINGSPSDVVIAGNLAVAGVDTDGIADRAKSFDSTNDYIDSFTNIGGLRITGDLTIEMWLLLDDAASSETILRCSVVAGSDILYSVGAFNGTGTRLVLYGEFFNVDGVTLNTGQWYHLVFTRQNGVIKTYVDGVLQATGSLATPVAASTQQLAIGARPDPGSHFGGDISEVAIYAKALSAGRVAAHYNARLMFGGGETVNNNLVALISLPGWPTALHSVLGTSSATAAIPSVTVDESFLSLLRRITESQETPIFINRIGELVEMTRDYQAISKNTPDFTIGDGASEFSYENLNIPNDSSLIRNLWRVTPIGGVVEEVSDTTSKSSFGPRDKQISNALIAENQSPVDTTGSQTLALARAQSGLAKTKDAIFRIEKVTINPMSDADYWQHILPVDLTDRIKINRTPPGGSIQTHEAYVEHIRHDFTIGKKWTTTLRLSPASLQDQWILGDSVMSLLGETSRLGW